jgi:hypothetical protein
MAYFVWCKKEERRLPNFRCLLCSYDCYPSDNIDGEDRKALEVLINSGRYKERFLMKRKERLTTTEQLRLFETKNDSKELDAASEQREPEERIFLLEDGKLKPFSPKDYSAATLYQMIEAFSVECKLVRPEDPGHVVFEGKKPSRKTLPIVITKNEASVLLESWDELEIKPEMLSDAVEVIGVAPVKQVFVLRRK